jgi:hypothetical protein
MRGHAAAERLEGRGESAAAAEPATAEPATRAQCCARLAGLRKRAAPAARETAGTAAGTASSAGRAGSRDADAMLTQAAEIPARRRTRRTRRAGAPPRRRRPRETLR